MKRFRLSLVLAVVLAVAVAVSLGATRASAGKGDKVVVEPGQKVEIALTSTGQFGPGFKEGPFNAVMMAIAMHPTIRGFPIQVKTVDIRCSSDPVPPATDVLNRVAATAIVTHVQNTAVIGDFCSSASQVMLPIYEEAGVVAISGSATRDNLPTLAPTVFNRTVVSEGDGGEAWFAQVTGLPSVQDWNHYHGAFPVSGPTSDFDSLYFDAATLLLDRLQQVSKIKDGNLVIDRKELAKAVRRTTDFPGVTCTITLDPKTGNRINDPASLAGCAG